MFGFCVCSCCCYGAGADAVVGGFLLSCCWRFWVWVLATLFVVLFGFVWVCVVFGVRGCVLATGVYYVVCVVFDCCAVGG